MDAIDFFGHMFGPHVSPSETIATWSLPSKATVFHTSVKSAAQRAMEVASSEDSYFGCGLYRPGIQGGRGLASDVRSITSVWADVDYGETHAKEGTPPSIIEAMKVVERISLKPSIVIDSGYGLHIYWLLKEPLLAKDDATTISRRFGATVLECARCLSFTVDSVHDISRVMRVPGTTNYKHGAAKVVAFLKDYSMPLMRYDLPDIEVILVDESVSKANKTATVHVSAVILNLSRAPSVKLIEAMCTNDPKDKKTWEKKRTDLADQSPSGYDMALAHIGAKMEMTDQQIADLIIGWRVKHGVDSNKALRQQYIQSTIAKARIARKKDSAIQKLAQSVAVPAGKGQTLTAGERQDLLDTLSQTFGVKISRWVQHGQERAEFSLVLEDGTDLLIGDMSDVLKQQSFRTRLLESTAGVMLPSLKPKAWTAVIIGLTRIREIVINPEGTRVGQIEDWLSSYLNTVDVGNPSTNGTMGQFLLDNKPFRKDGALYVHASHLHRHVMFGLQERVAKRALAGMLRVAGWAREDLSGTVTNQSGQRISLSRSYWKKK